MSQEYNYAGFWWRALAYFIDGIVVLAITIPIILLLAAVLGSESIVPNLVSIVAGWLYFSFMESSGKQGTLGKMALGIIVTDVNGGRISFGRATGRYFGKIISMIILYIGFFMAGFTARKQGLHDMMAGTLVLKKKAPDMGTVQMPVE